MTTKYHSGEGYTKEQEEALDEMFSEYLRLDNRADAARYDNDSLNAAADEAYQVYEETKATFDEFNALDWPRVIRTLAGLVDYSVSLQWDDVMVDAR